MRILRTYTHDRTEDKIGYIVGATVNRIIRITNMEMKISYHAMSHTIAFINVHHVQD